MYDPFGTVKLVQNIAVKRVAATIKVESEVPIWDYVICMDGSVLQYLLLKCVVALRIATVKKKSQSIVFCEFNI